MATRWDACPSASPRLAPVPMPRRAGADPRALLRGEAVAWLGVLLVRDPGRARADALPPAPRLRDERRTGDARRLLVVPLRGGEGLVDLLERVLVGDDAIPGPARLRAHEKVEGARDDPRVVLDDPHDLLRAPDEQCRL